MKEFTDFFDELLLEWSYRVPTGIPNTKNAYHLYLLRIILEEMSIEPKVINEIVSSLKRGGVREFLHEAEEKLLPGPSTEVGTKRYYYTDNQEELHLVTKGYANKQHFSPATKDDVATKKPKEAEPEKTEPDTEKGESGIKTPDAKIEAYRLDSEKIDLFNFHEKSEITKGLFGSTPETYTEITFKRGDETKIIKSRTMFDPDTGTAIDVTKEEGKIRAVELIKERLESPKIKEKIKKAVELIALARTNKEEFAKVGQPTNLFHKYLAEMGELKALESILETGNTAYLLTDSEPKNDIIIVGKNEQIDLDAALISVKTAEAGTQLNKLGANIKSDLKMYLSETENPDAPVKLKLGDTEIEENASVIINTAMQIGSRELINFATRGRAYKGYTWPKKDKGNHGSSIGFMEVSDKDIEDGILKPEVKKCRGYEKDLPYDNAKKYNPTPQTKDGVTEMTCWLRNRVVKTSDIDSAFESGNILSRVQDLDSNQIAQDDPERAKKLLDFYKKDLKDFISEKEATKGFCSAYDIQNEWMIYKMCRAMSVIGAKPVPTGNTLGTYYNSEGLVGNYVIDNSEQQKTYNLFNAEIDKHPEEKERCFAKITGRYGPDGKFVTIQPEEKKKPVPAVPFRARTRILGDGAKTDKGGHLDGMENSSPLITGAEPVLTVAEFLRKVGIEKY